jgi:hypothetical protein
MVEAAVPMVLTRGWPDLLSRFLFVVGGQDEPTISRIEIKMATEG